MDNVFHSAVDALPDDARRLHLLCGLRPGKRLTILRGLHHDALGLFDQALTVFRRVNDQYQIAHTFLGRVPALLGTGRVDDAAEASENATFTRSAIQAVAAAEALARVETAQEGDAARRRYLEAVLERYQSLHAPKAQRVQAASPGHVPGRPGLTGARPASPWGRATIRPRPLARRWMRASVRLIPSGGPGPPLLAGLFNNGLHRSHP